MPSEKQVTGAELAILSILVEKPMHGYMLERVIEERNMRDWTPIGFSSIYYILRKLLKLGWLKRSLDKNEAQGPARQVYSLTDAGRRKWKAAVLKALSTPNQFNNLFQLGLANIGNLELDEVSRALQTHQTILSGIYQNVQGKFAFQKAYMPWYVRGMFELSQEQLRSELRWLGDFIQVVENRS